EEPKRGCETRLNRGRGSPTPIRAVSRGRLQGFPPSRLHGSPNLPEDRQGPSLVSVFRLLLIVSRTEPGHYTYLRRVFGGAAVDVILDRRMAERRQRLEEAAPDRRREFRRQRDISKDLQMSGWAVVRTTSS